MTERQKEGLIKTMVAPSSFSGDKSVDKTADVRDWVEEAEKCFTSTWGQRSTVDCSLC